MPVSQTTDPTTQTLHEWRWKLNTQWYKCNI